MQESEHSVIKRKNCYLTYKYIIIFGHMLLACSCKYLHLVGCEDAIITIKSSNQGLNRPQIFLMHAKNLVALVLSMQFVMSPLLRPDAPHQLLKAFLDLWKKSKEPPWDLSFLDGLTWTSTYSMGLLWHERCL
jgi:hypothetical protein